jgi:hypothetical protein
MTISILTHQLLSPESVRLGRLVLDIHAPWQDFCPKTLIPLTADDILTAPFLHVKEIVERTRDTKFHASLSEALSGVLGKQQTSSVSIAAPRGTTYTILNSGYHFEQICRDADVRAWIERAIMYGYPVFMVVGFITLMDAKVVGSIHTSSQVQGDVTVPVTNIVTSGVGAVVPSTLGAILDSGIGVDKLISDVAKASYESPGEKVFAVQYRKVKYEWFNGKKVETAFLERGNRWIIQGGYRNTLEDEEDDEDLVAAELMEGPNVEELEANYEAYCTADGVEFLLVDHEQSDIQM